MARRVPSLVLAAVLLASYPASARLRLLDGELVLRPSELDLTRPGELDLTRPGELDLTRPSELDLAGVGELDLPAPWSPPGRPAPLLEQAGAALAPRGGAIPPGPQAHFVADSIVTGVTAASWLTLQLLLPVIGRPSCPCDRDDVNAFDRGAIDYDFAAGTTLSDTLAAISVAAPLGVFYAVKPNYPTFFSDSLLVLESAVTSGIVAQAAKTGIARPYPYMYRDPLDAGVEVDDGTNYASFWSGHTAATMASVVSFAYIFQYRRPHSPWRWVAWTVGPLVSVGAGLLQMSDANHFPTDVIVGAITGAGFGLLIPWLHE